MTPRRSRPARALLALLLAATASGAWAGVFRSASPAPATAEVARAPFEPDAFGSVFGRAVGKLQRSGYALQACDADRGSLTTLPREFDAPCGGSTCLARQSVAVLLGYRAARVTLVREVFDPTVKAWVLAEREAWRAEAEDLARAIVSPETPADRSADPCGYGSSQTPARQDPAAAGPHGVPSGAGASSQDWTPSVQAVNPAVRHSTPVEQG